MVGKIGEHDGVEHAEDGRVCADADSQGQDGDSRENAGAFASERMA